MYEKLKFFKNKSCFIDEKNLLKILDKYLSIVLILEYRELNKFFNIYIIFLLRLKDKDDKIYIIFI